MAEMCCFFNNVLDSLTSNSDNEEETLYRCDRLGDLVLEQGSQP